MYKNIFRAKILIKTPTGKKCIINSSFLTLFSEYTYHWGSD